MFNSSAFNTRTFNAAAGTAVLAASVSWSTGAAFGGEPIHTQAAKGTFDGRMGAIFSGDREVFGFWRPTVDSGNAFNQHVIYAGGGDWQSSISLNSFVIQIIAGEAGMDTASSFEAIPNSLLGEGDWSGGASPDLVPTKIGAIKGHIQNDTTLSSEGVATRRMNGTWAGTADLWMEATYTNASGDTLHDGFLKLVPTSDFGNANYLTATFTNGAFKTVISELEVQQTLIQAIEGEWAPSSALSPEAQKIQYGKVDESVAGQLSLVQTLTQAAEWDRSINTSLQGPTWVNQAGQLAWTGSVETTFEPFRISRGSAGFQGEADWSGLAVRLAEVEADWLVGGTPVWTPNRITFAETAWDGLGSYITAAAVLTGAPAPSERTYTVPFNDRTYVVPGDDRFFEVAA